MKRRDHFLHHQFHVGELYLFHRTDHSCTSSGCLFGIFDKVASGILYLESSSLDLQHFRYWHPLPADYHYYRPASRSELRDYMANQAYSECLLHGHGLRVRP